MKQRNRHNQRLNHQDASDMLSTTMVTTATEAANGSSTVQACHHVSSRQQEWWYQKIRRPTEEHPTVNSPDDNIVAPAIPEVPARQAGLV